MITQECALGEGSWHCQVHVPGRVSFAAPLHLFSAGIVVWVIGDLLLPGGFTPPAAGHPGPGRAAACGTGAGPPVRAAAAASLHAQPSAALQQIKRPP